MYSLPLRHGSSPKITHRAKPNELCRDCMNAAGQTICLSMIVKNEAPVIRRCLDSVRSIIDCWAIVDTGSTDGTQDLVRATMAGIPGELHERPWVDFAHNRTEALQLARGRADYSLVIDADDTLEVPADFAWPELAADAYSIEIRDSNIRYRRTQLVHNTLPWRYEGILHEFLTCEGAQPEALLEGFFMRRNHDGARRRDPSTYRRDAEILEAALAGEVSDFLRTRYTFYLAQSYRDFGAREKALEAYLARAEMGFWDQERYIALYQAALLKADLDYPPDEVIAAFERSTGLCPFRSEALHAASRYCRYKGRNEEGYQLAKRGLAVPRPSGSLFGEPWIYDYGLLDELSVNGYWSGHYKESLRACLDLLEKPETPADMRARVIGNARFCTDRLSATGDPEALQIKVRNPGHCPSWPVRSPSPRPDHAPLVTIITPTHGRAEFLIAARNDFLSQDYSNLEWLILDDSPSSHPAFKAVWPSIFYTHITEKLTVGAKRNWLVERARGDIIVHFDDDDYYAPDYVTRMVAELERRNADLINLRGWWLYDLRTETLAYWDLEHKRGPHFRCDGSGVSIVMLGDHNEAGFHDNHYGFGFSYVYRKKVWEKAGFQDVDFNEDGLFSRAARNEFSVDGFPDTTGLTLHYLHEKSSSRCFPQYLAPEFMKDKILNGISPPGKAAQASLIEGTPPSYQPLILTGSVTDAVVEFTNNWFDTTARAIWDQLIPRIRPERILEVGSYEGASACYLIGQCAQERPIEIYCIDTWEGGSEHKSSGVDMASIETRFHHNVAAAAAASKHPVRIFTLKGRSERMLVDLSSRHFLEYFDLIYIDGSHEAPDVFMNSGCKVYH
jgi:glycosyltransferase involved in cell wall biosynthesis